MVFLDEKLDRINGGILRNGVDYLHFADVVRREDELCEVLRKLTVPLRVVEVSIRENQLVPEILLRLFNQPLGARQDAALV